MARVSLFEWASDMTNTTHHQAVEQDNTKPQWFLYLIRTANDSLYCGVTTNVERRFREHSSGGNKSARYLRGKGPLTLVFYVAVGNRSQALILERRIKRLSKVQKEHLVQTQCLPD